MIQFIIGMFAVIGVFAFVFVIYVWFFDSSSKKEAEAEVEIYTEEEKFLADLLILKNDLDADKFATQKEVLAELEKHTPTDNYFDGDVL